MRGDVVELACGTGQWSRLLDETADGVLDKEQWTADPDRVTRRLADGSTHDVVKLRLEATLPTGRHCAPHDEQK